MLTPQEARAAMLAAFVSKAQTESIALDDAFGRVLARDVRATRDQPPFAGSAMDGYALRASEAPGRLRVIGEAAAGRGLAQALKAGEAARIFTGAPLPEGADSVLIQEEAGREGDILIAPAIETAQNVRARGIDFHAGDLLLRKGVPLDGVALALAASSGLPQLEVYKSPRIAILATGDEIISPGATPEPHQIFEGGSFGIAGLVKAWGGAPKRMKSEGDRVEAIAAAIETGLADADLLITIGGASVGDHDLVRPALAHFDARFAVEKIAVRPGKPTFFAQTRIGAVLGLPGNPASGMVCAHLFLKPLIEAWFGRDSAQQFAQAHLAAPLPKNGPREHYLRSMLSIENAQLKVRAAEDQDSSLISVFQGAGVLIRRMPNAPPAREGELVEIVDLRRPQ
jgi:molybdopterin molybdotransferase